MCKRLFADCIRSRHQQRNRKRNGFHRGRAVNRRAADAAKHAITAGSSASGVLFRLGWVCNLTSAGVQVFGRRQSGPHHALWRPAPEKRQGTKSREIEHQSCSKRYGDLILAPASTGPRRCPDARWICAGTGGRENALGMSIRLGRTSTAARGIDRHGWVVSDRRRHGTSGLGRESHRADGQSHS